MADSWDPAVHKSAFVSKDAVLEGPVRLGEGCVVHPGAELRAIGGPLVVGAFCVFEDECRVINPMDDSAAEDITMEVGSHNVFGERCAVQGGKVRAAALRPLPARLTRVAPPDWRLQRVRAAELGHAGHRGQRLPCRCGAAAATASRRAQRALPATVRENAHFNPTPGPLCALGEGAAVDDCIAVSTTSAGQLRHVRVDPGTIAACRATVTDMSARLRAEDGLPMCHENVAASFAAQD